MLPITWNCRKRGQSLTEFALVAPLLVAVLFGIIEVGLLFSAYVGLTNSAREGARAAAIYRYPGPAPLSNDTTTLTMIDTARIASASTVISNTLSPLIAASQLVVTLGYTPTTALPSNPYRAGDLVAVQLEYPHALFFGLFGQQELRLRATSTMRLEPGGAQ